MTTERCRGWPALLAVQDAEGGDAMVRRRQLRDFVVAVRMTSRPVPPHFRPGDEGWFCFDSFGEYAERLTREPSPVNINALIGHGPPRVETAGQKYPQPAATDR